MKTFEQYNTEKSEMFTEEEKKKLFEDPDKFFNKKLEEYKKQLIADIKKVFLGKSYAYLHNGKRIKTNPLKRLSVAKDDEEGGYYYLYFYADRTKKKKYSSDQILHHGKKFEILENYERKRDAIKKVDPYEEEDWK